MLAAMRKMAVFFLMQAMLIFTGCGAGGDEADALKSVVNVYLNGLQGENWAAAESAWSKHVNPIEMEIRKTSAEALFEALDLEYSVEKFEVIRMEEVIASAQVVCAIRKRGGDGVFTNERLTSFYTFVRSDAKAPWRIYGCEDMTRVEIPAEEAAEADANR